MEAKESTDKPPQGEKQGRVKRKLLGPDQDAEEHEHPDWWRSLFNHLSPKTDIETKATPNKPLWK